MFFFRQNAWVARYNLSLLQAEIISSGFHWGEVTYRPEPKFKVLQYWTHGEGHGSISAKSFAVKSVYNLCTYSIIFCMNHTCQLFNIFQHSHMTWQRTLPILATNRCVSSWLSLYICTVHVCVFTCSSTSLDQSSHRTEDAAYLMKCTKGSEAHHPSSNN